MSWGVIMTGSPCTRAPTQPQDWQAHAALPPLDVWLQEGLPVELYREIFMGGDANAFADLYPDAQLQPSPEPLGDAATQHADPPGDPAAAADATDPVLQLWLAEGLPAEFFQEFVAAAATPALAHAGGRADAAPAGEGPGSEEPQPDPAAEDVCGEAEAACRQAEAALKQSPPAVPRRMRGSGKQRKKTQPKKKPKATFKRGKTKKKDVIPGDGPEPEAPAPGSSEVPPPGRC